MKSSRIAVPMAVALAALVAPPTAAFGAPPAYPEGVSRSVDQPWESITVTGTGEVSGEPTLLTANFAVETTAPTVEAALARANSAATRMRDTLVRAGIARADLQTADVGVHATRNEDERIIGYTANQGLTAKIRNLPRAGALMSAAIAAGGDAARLNGVSFAIEDDTALLAEARKKAFADARAKADLYAREAGRPLGRVLKVSEDVARYGEPMGHKYMSMADSAVPVEPGRQQLSVTVTVEWAMTQS